MSDLDTLFPVSVTVEVGGITVEIRELTVPQVTEFLRTATPLMSVLSGAAGFELSELLPQMETVVLLVAVATGVDRTWLNTLPAREMLRLITAVVEVNADFFTAALPAFVRHLTAVGARMTAGLTSSSG